MTEKFKVGNKDIFSQPELKRQLNRELFSIVAPRYDLITKLLSFGKDYSWKKQLIAKLPLDEAAICVDIACGTGDLCNLLLSRYPQTQLIGIDLCEAMLELAKQRTIQNKIQYILADMLQLPVSNNSVDIITGGYALRNAPDLNLFLEEIYRKLRPGGYATFLDFSKPQKKSLATINHHLLSGWCRFWGFILHRNSEIYGYIPFSLESFPNTRQLKTIILQKGFTAYQSQQHFNGITESILFQKPTGQGSQKCRAVTLIS